MTRVIDKGKSYAFLPQFERGPRGDMTGRIEKILRSAIVGLDFAPGEFIDKGLVCLQLGVSRFPVSEALARLANEGLVEVLPQRGTRAARVRLREVAEAMLIRRALEAMVAELAATDFPQESLALLDANLAAQEAAVAEGDRPRFYALDLAFHAALVDGLKLERVAAVIEASRASVDRVRRLLSSPRRHAVTLEEHRALVKAVAARDPEGARRAMETHLDAVMTELERFSAKHPEVFVDL
jgi:DNA-binding GntR family transcriptional regulator